jgi:hypothetical protein
VVFSNNHGYITYHHPKVQLQNTRPNIMEKEQDINQWLDIEGPVMECGKVS